MFIAIVVMVIGYHLLRLTLETHTLVTSATSNSIAPISPHNRHFTASIWAFSDTIFFHILLKSCISTLLSFFTSQTRMIIQFASDTICLITLIAVEMSLDQEINLFTSSSVAIRYYFRITANKLI